MYKVLLSAVAGFALSGCMEPEMDDVMASCESNSNFTSYVNCIKTDYKRDPSASTVRSLIARLNSINEDYENGSISEIKARAAARIAYDETVGEGNARRRSNAAASYRAPTAAASYRAPTTCYTTGNITNCH